MCGSTVLLRVDGGDSKVLLETRNSVDVELGVLVVGENAVLCVLRW